MPIAKLQNTSCSVSRSLAILGERWTVLILRDALEGFTRFEEFRGSLGLAADVLSDRLSTLVEYGLMTRVSYREPGHRARHEYHLTDAGRELHVIVGGLQLWGDSHLPWPGGPSTFRRSARTGEALRVAFVDQKGRAVPLDEVRTLHTNGYPSRG
ncbi:helix-turn-helix domain-containing protein [Amycolatopsis sp. NPDC005961]|uniref:winged helix-turn-helix transcriptional regulator n=1 Tax=Amycolatopsis sp. NPDC005961 TaxID=3156720 RepID=UPI0033D269D1